MLQNEKLTTRLTAVLVTAAVLFSLALFFLPGAGKSQPVVEAYEADVFNSDVISVNIIVDETAWQGMLDNALAEEYIPCDVVINGVTYSDVGIRPKGNTSLTSIANDDTTDRYSFKIEFDHYIDGQSMEGLDKLALNNIMSDATYMKEYLTYYMMDEMGVDSPLCTYADVKLNGVTWGFYLAVECVEESFLERNYGTDYGSVYKPEGDNVGGGGNMADSPNGNAGTQGDGNTNAGAQGDGNTNAGAQGGGNTNAGAQGGGNMGGGMNSGTAAGSDLAYIDDNTDSYTDIFSNEIIDTTEEQRQAVVTALRTLASGENLESAVDIESVLRYFAVNTFTVNLDSYVSSLRHNYYLYEEDGILSIIPWDFNLSFAGFQAGTATAAVNFPIDTPVTGVTLESRPLLAKLLENETYLAQYHQYLNELLTSLIDSGKLTAKIAKTNGIIADYVKNDPSAFYTYDEYQTGVATLESFITLRAQSVKGQLEGTIPSTTDGQSADASTLVDASSIDLTAMGTQGGGNNAGGGNDNMGGGNNAGDGNNMGGGNNAPSFGDGTQQPPSGGGNNNMGDPPARPTATDTASATDTSSTEVTPAAVSAGDNADNSSEDSLPMFYGLITIILVCGLLVAVLHKKSY